MSKEKSSLWRALNKRETDYREALGRVREALESDAPSYEAATELREAVALVGCLRRLVDCATVEQLHTAFGAPGDFGYETAIGEALARIYRGEK